MFLISHNSLSFHLVVEAKLTVLEAGQDQALELEADYELLHGVGLGKLGQRGRHRQQHPWLWQQHTDTDDWSCQILSPHGPLLTTSGAQGVTISARL